MILTGEQVCEKLNITKWNLKILIKKGLLKPINAPKENAKKFFAKFDSKDINEFSKTFKKKEVKTLQVSKKDSPISGFFSKLDHIERSIENLQESVDNLLKLWS